MIGRCKFNTGKDIPGRGRMAVSPDAVYPVEVGRGYTIMGMGIFETDFSVLICDETGKPFWHPIGLFEIAAQEIPPHWEFCLLDGVAASGGDSINRWVAKWGYPELVRDPAHSESLMDRNPVALDLFFRRLAESSLQTD